MAAMSLITLVQPVESAESYMVPLMREAPKVGGRVELGECASASPFR